MTSQNNQTIAARRAAIRRVRMGLEARIQERLAYACGATVYQPLAVSERCHPITKNREFSVNIERRMEGLSGMQESLNGKDCR
ncbi:MAG: hypothetical protein NXI24_18030 [bacterium]|nr:hypothetical protein [bacterium]